MPTGREVSNSCRSWVASLPTKENARKHEGAVAAAAPCAEGAAAVWPSASGEGTCSGRRSPTEWIRTRTSFFLWRVHVRGRPGDRRKNSRPKKRLKFCLFSIRYRYRYVDIEKIKNSCYMKEKMTDGPHILDLSSYHLKVPRPNTTQFHLSQLST